MNTASGAWSVGNTMPGWGIVADLTPPELITGRRLRIVRRLVIIGVAFMVLVAASGYGWATWQHGNAEDALVAEQDHTRALLAEQKKYSAVTMVRGTIAHVQQQIAGLMAGDVDVDALVGSVVGALPAGMTIDQLSVAVALPDNKTGGGANDKSGGVGSLDRSEAKHIGTVTVSGTGTALTDLAAYVQALGKTPGVFEPYPTSNQVADGGTTYSLQLTLTDALLTHRYEVQEGGS